MLVRGCVDMVALTHERSTQISKETSVELIERSSGIKYQDNGGFGTLVLYGVEEGIIYTISFPKLE